MQDLLIRDEQPGDENAVNAVIEAAFRAMPYSKQTEVALLAGLRAAGALSVSLVALEADLVGHIAFSPVSIGEGARGWFGMGPVAVRPDRQRKGIGCALVAAGLDRLRALGAEGCVLVGNPDFYGRFGFRSSQDLSLAGVPPQYLLALSLAGGLPRGEVRFHPAFNAAS